jgi:ribonuclease BN (tRNA processing enzyme)
MATAHRVKRSRLVVPLMLVSGLAARGAGQGSGAAAPARVATTQIVFLGTGTPRPDPQRQGPSLAIVVAGKAYLVDAGTGVVRQAQAAASLGIEALEPSRLDIAFITHLHSDHTLGLPDLVLTPWVQQRAVPLELYGPAGIDEMAASILKAYEQDIHIRVTGLEAESATAYHVNAHRVQPGTVYQDASVKVTAFAVKHGSWPEAYGYRFDTPGKSIVCSGDTAPTESMVEACHGCDVLIHEAYSGAGGVPGKSVEAWMKYMASFHTSAGELAGIATRAQAKTLILTHYMFLGDSNESDMVNTIRRGFGGMVIVAHDLDVIAP